MGFRMRSLLDGSAIGVSGLCLAHCLVLPAVAALLPALGAWAAAEWVHALFVLVAGPLAVIALAGGCRQAGHRHGFVVGLGAIGVALLAAGAFLSALRAWEVPVTVTGSLALATAHLINWRLHRARLAGRRLEQPLPDMMTGGSRPRPPSARPLAEPAG